MLKEQKLDALIAGNFGQQISDDLLYYLLLKKLELGLLYIPTRGKATLFAISFEVTQLKREYPELKILPYNESPDKLIKTVIASNKVKMGFRNSALPVEIKNLCSKIKGICFSTFYNDEKLFALKSPREIQLLREACRVTDRLFKELTNTWKQFKTESEAAQFLLKRMIDYGVEPSFPPIIASGAHAADPHYGYSKSPIQKGFCVIDMGVRYQGYCSDMTRSIYVGKPNEKELNLYAILANAQKQSIDAVCPGANIKQIDEQCRETLGRELNELFIHSLGHGLGTQVHEWPRVASNDIIAEEGMVITIEPGLYKKGAYGMRIEDDILVRKTGQEALSKSPRELLVIA